MPIISTIGRRSFKTRFLIGTIYTALIVGGLTMVYPFWLMVVGSSKSAMDTPESRVIPAFYRDVNARWGKFLEGLFNESVVDMATVHGGDPTSFQTLQVPESVNTSYVEAWEGFLDSEAGPDQTGYEIAFLIAPVTRNVQTYHLRQFKRQMQERFDGSIEKFNTELRTTYASWNLLNIRSRIYLHRRIQPTAGELSSAIDEFRASVPLGLRYYANAEGFYRAEYLKVQFTRDIARFNDIHGTSYNSYDEVHLLRRAPRLEDGYTQAERDAWEDFVRNILNQLWIRVSGDALPAYQAYLKDAWIGDLDRLNAAYGTSYVSFDEIPLVRDSREATGRVRSDWVAFIAGWQGPEGQVHAAPLDSLIVDSVEWRFRDWLEATYASLDAANAALGTEATRWEQFFPPQREMHYRFFEANKNWLLWEFSVRNFITVFEYLALQGRGIFNTAIYCTLAILGALIVNPLAAYGLSRYKPPSTYKMLLIMMLTMAFPPMVGMIPQFLLLRNFGMLNTFWALVLPGLASGYFIFLLKGFFDSLPQELYESAELDGAGEIRIFLQITMALSKPVLAVIALQAFTAAYSNFMFALLICQDERMWTIMPWLYQLQQRSGQGVVFASLVISAVPTFLIFAFCQNIIMRGIVVPVEK